MTFVIYVILLYILICSHFKKVIMKYTVENMEISFSKRVSNERVASRFHKYESVLNTIIMFEPIMRVPIFLSFSFSVVEAFYGMLTLMKIKEINQKNSIKELANLIRGFVSLCLISFTASSVNQADQKARDSNDNLIRKSFASTNILSLDAKQNMLHENSKPAFVLTAWGFFEIKRSLFFTAIGCIFTYTLLFINLEG